MAWRRVHRAGQGPARHGAGSEEVATGPGESRSGVKGVGQA